MLNICVCSKTEYSLGKAIEDLSVLLRSALSSSCSICQ